MTLEDAGKIKNTEIAQELCLPPVKREYNRFSFRMLARDEEDGYHHDCYGYDNVAQRVLFSLGSGLLKHL